MKASGIRIAAPSLQAAVALCRKLSPYEPVLVGLRHGWTVELDAPGSRLDEIRAEAHDWLLELAEPATVILVDRVPEALAVDLPELVPGSRVRRGRGDLLAATARRRGGNPQRESGGRPIPS
ncbi:MAG TPA: hypothetical protein VGN27_07905 [Gaiellaceae bacterium]|nr:hypothetical protein [Gaiellaceae bacterium]